jgi:hypothetical protein
MGCEISILVPQLSCLSLYDFLNIFSSASRCCGSNLLVPELFQNLCAASVIETETQRRSDGSKREIPLSPVFVAENFLEMMIKRFSFTFKPIALSRRKFGSSQHLLMKPVEQKLCEPADMGRRQFFNCGSDYNSWGHGVHPRASKQALGSRAMHSRLFGSPSYPRAFIMLSKQP